MDFLFFVLALALYGLGYLAFFSTASALQETSGLMVFLIGTIFLVGGGIINAIKRNTRMLKSPPDSAPKPKPAKGEKKIREEPVMFEQDSADTIEGFKGARVKR